MSLFCKNVVLLSGPGRIVNSNIYKSVHSSVISSYFLRIKNAIQDCFLGAILEQFYNTFSSFKLGYGHERRELGKVKHGV